MTTLEITLIIIGVVFLIGSFMVNDKLSHKDLDKIADMRGQQRFSKSVETVSVTPFRVTLAVVFSLYVVPDLMA